MPYQSRFGGCAQLPPDQEWPSFNDGPLDFLLQINLSDVDSKPMPSSGLLSVFYDVEKQPWGFRAEDATSCRVIYTAEEDLVHTTTIRKPGSDGPFRSEAMDEHLSGLMLLGTPDLIQNDTLEAQAERMTLGSDGVQIDEAAAKRKWMLLMQVESKEAVYGHMWGDSGCLYFMIPRSDLKASVFTNVRCILQCY
ncbi:DUF1963 domain-containing protein [Pycnococcus provasolii]